MAQPLNQSFAKKFKLKQKDEEEQQSMGPTLASVAGNVAKMGIGGGSATEEPKTQADMDAMDLKAAPDAKADPLDSIPKKPDEAKGESMGMDANLAHAIIAGIPILLGAAFGGAEGGATGAQAGLTGLNFLNEAEKEEADKQERADVRLAAKQEKEADRAFEEKQFAAKQAFEEKLAGKKFEQEKYLAGLKAKQESSKDNPSEMPLEKRLSKLNATEKKDLSNIKTVFQSASGMGEALLAGEGTNKLIGDNNFTRFRRDYSEAITRLQSGGAFSKNEADTFRDMAPTALDPDDVKMEKLQAIKDRMADRLSIYGFKPEEFPDMLQAPRMAKVEQTFIDKWTGLGNKAQAKESAPQKSYSEMSDDELEELAKKRGLK